MKSMGTAKNKLANARRWIERNPNYAREWRERNPDYMREWKKANPDRVAATVRKQREKRWAAGTQPLRRAALGEIAAMVAALKTGETYAAVGAKFNRDSSTVSQWVAPWREDIKAALPACVGAVRTRCFCQACIQSRTRARLSAENQRRRLAPQVKAVRQAERAAKAAADKAARKAARAAAREAARPSEEECLRRKREAKRRERARYAAKYPEKKKIHRAVRKARRRAAEKHAVAHLTPEEKKKVSALYAKAQRLTRETGYQWDVHHVVALANGGLHHPDNLEVVTAEVNNAIGIKDITPLDYILS